MKLEHVGYNVAEPQKLMDWWCANLGFKQVHQIHLAKLKYNNCYTPYSLTHQPLTTTILSVSVYFTTIKNVSCIL